MSKGQNSRKKKFEFQPAAAAGRKSEKNKEYSGSQHGKIADTKWQIATCGCCRPKNIKKKMKTDRPMTAPTPPWAVFRKHMHFVRFFPLSSALPPRAHEAPRLGSVCKREKDFCVSESRHIHTFTRTHIHTHMRDRRSNRERFTCE